MRAGKETGYGRDPNADVNDEKTSRGGIGKLRSSKTGTVWCRLRRRLMRNDYIWCGHVTSSRTVRRSSGMRWSYCVGEDTCEREHDEGDVRDSNKWKRKIHTSERCTRRKMK